MSLTPRNFWAASLLQCITGQADKGSSGMDGYTRYDRRTIERENDGCWDQTRQRLFLEEQEPLDRHSCEVFLSGKSNQPVERGCTEELCWGETVLRSFELTFINYICVSRVDVRRRETNRLAFSRRDNRLKVQGPDAG